MSSMVSRIAIARRTAVLLALPLLGVPAACLASDQTADYAAVPSRSGDGSDWDRALANLLQSMPTYMSGTSYCNLAADSKHGRDNRDKSNAHKEAGRVYRRVYDRSNRSSYRRARRRSRGTGIREGLLRLNDFDDAWKRVSLRLAEQEAKDCKEGHRPEVRPRVNDCHCCV